MNTENHVQLSDRFKGTPAAQTAKFPKMLSKNCTKHLIFNMRAAKDVANSVRGVGGAARGGGGCFKGGSVVKK